MSSLKTSIALKKQVGCFNYEVVILVAASLRDRRCGRFTLVLETLIAQGNQRDSYPDHLTTLILHADSDH